MRSRHDCPASSEDTEPDGDTPWTTAQFDKFKDEQEFRTSCVEPGDKALIHLKSQIMIEIARISLWSFFGAVSEDTAVSVIDLYNQLYDRDINKTSDRSSTVRQFTRAMQAVTYMRWVVGPMNEIRVWTLCIFRAQYAYLLEDGNGDDQGSLERMESRVNQNIDSYRSDFKLQFGREPEGYPYNNKRAEQRERQTRLRKGETSELDDGIPAAPTHARSKHQATGARFGIVEFNQRCEVVYKDFGTMIDPKCPLCERVSMSHTISHGVERALSKLVNHGRRVELDMRDGLGPVGLSQARITTAWDEAEQVLYCSGSWQRSLDIV